MGLLLIMSIVFPTVFVWPKLALLSVATICTTCILMTGRALLSQRWVLVTLLYVILGVGASVHGVIVGAPGALRVLSVMAVYPIIFTMLAFTYRSGDLDWLFDVFVWAAWILIAVDLAYVLSNIFLPGNPYVAYIENLYEETAVIDSENFYYKFTIPNVSSLLFLLPFFFSALIAGVKNRSQANLALLSLLFAIIAILSGRRALLVAFISGPVLMVLMGAARGHRKSVRGSRWKKLMYVAVLAGIIFGVFITFDLFDFYSEQISSILDFENNSSNLERGLQFDALMDGVWDAPFFGNGAGAAASYTRSETQPWAYELSYIALIYQYGLIGFSIYACGVGYLIIKLRKLAIEREGGGLAAFYLAGMLSFLIANATNPYLAKFDYMWVIFIPVAIVMARKRGV